MITIETIEVSGWKGALKGMRNAWESWAKSDSHACDRTKCGDCVFDAGSCVSFVIGPEDMRLAKSLIKSGASHRKFFRFLHVQFDIKAPLFMLKELDTYKVGTACNSTSTMHTVTKKEFEMMDFSAESLEDSEEYHARATFECILHALNQLRKIYLRCKERRYWRQIIELLPSSFNQLRTYDMTYETLYCIYHDRKNHKLSEWHQFCDWIETLPYMKEFLSE